MAADWRIGKGEKIMAARICDRVYEVLQDFQDEVQEGIWEYYDPSAILDELRARLMGALPFDPEPSP